MNNPAWIDQVRERVQSDIASEYSRGQLTWDEYRRAVAVMDRTLAAVLEVARKHAQKGDGNRTRYRYDDVLRDVG